MGFVNFAELQRLAAPKRVHVPQWGGDVAIGRLNPLQKLSLVKKFEAFPRDDDNRLVNTADAIQFGIELLAQTIADDQGARPFDTPDGREFLAQTDLGTLQLLIDESILINGLSREQTVATLDAAKKN